VACTTSLDPKCHSNESGFEGIAIAVGLWVEADYPLREELSDNPVWKISLNVPANIRENLTVAGRQNVADDTLAT